MRLNMRLHRDRRGSAAAEMALVLPLLLILMFGTFELGYYFLSEHVVQKAVRDAARYAARLPISEYPSCAMTPGATQQVQLVARTGQPDGTEERLRGWTENAMTEVSVDCVASGTYGGVFEDFPDGVPVVTVTAAVPYPTLFGTFGLSNASSASCSGQDTTIYCLRLNAESQSAVFGA